MKKLIISISIIIGLSGTVWAQDGDKVSPSFNINPLGLLQFGPIFQYEAPIAKKICLVPYFRYAYAGVLTHAVWTGFEEDDELSPGTFAIGTVVKGFSSTTENSFYYGGFVDLARAKANYSVGYTDETEERSTELTIGPNVGYRWHTSSSMYFNVGLLTGISFALKDEERYVSDNELYGTYNDTLFFAMVEFSFGWEW